MKDFEFFKLEDRVLFEAAAAAEIVEAAEAAQFDPNADVSESERQAQEERNALKNAPPENPAAATESVKSDDPDQIADVNADIDALIDGEIPPGMMDEASGRELVVINSSMPDKEAFINALEPDQEVLILDNNTGLAELNAFLDGSDVEYSAIHLVSHGGEGHFVLNGELISSGKFDAAAWQAIGEHLSENGDIMLYGCDVAAGAEGKALVGMIAQASGADVAASTDVTGISGNWELEYHSGTIETAEIEVDEFAHDLDTITVDALEADDTAATTTLQEAIELAYNNAGADVIVFADSLNGKTIMIDSALEINDSVQIIGNGVSETIIDGGGVSGIFEYYNVLDGKVDISISNMTLQNGFRSVNTPSGEDGGAIYIHAFGINSDDSITLSLDNVTIADSHASNGGGVAIIADYCDVELNIRNSTFYGNNAVAGTSGDGGAVYVTATGFKINVVDSTITGNFDANSDGYSGGGIFAKADINDSEMNIVNSIVFGNYNVDASGNTTGGSDIYSVSESSDISVTNRMIHSIYGVTLEGSAPGEVEWPLESDSGSTQLAFNDANVKAVFGTGEVKLDDNNVIQVSNAGVAGYSGTLTGYDASGNLVYMDTSDGSWVKLDGSAASEPSATTSMLFTDELGNSRTAALTYLGVREFFVGAVAGKTLIKVTGTDASYKYDGTAKDLALTYRTAGNSVVSSGGKLAITADGANTADVAADGVGKNVGKYDFLAKDLTVSISYDSTDVTGKFEFSGANVPSGADAEVADAKIGTIEITKRQVVITADSASKVYDGTVLTDNGYTYSAFDGAGGFGFIAGEGLASVTVEGSQLNAGSSDNVITGHTLDSNTLAQNYEISYAKGTLTVTPRQITIVVNSGQSMTYGDAMPDLQYTVGGDGLAPTETSLTGELALAGMQMSSSGNLNAGSYEIIQNTLNQANNPNYEITGFTGSTFTVGQKTLDITQIVVNSKVYDGKTDAVIAGGTVSGVISGDDAGINWSKADADFASPNAGKDIAVSLTGGLSITGGDKGNYKLPDSYDISGSGDINPKKVEVKFVTDQPYYYDATDQSGTVSAYYEDIHGNKIDLPINWNGKIFASVGTYDISVTITDSNYTAVNTQTTLTILPNNPAGGDYADGVNNLKYAAVIPSIQGGLTAGGFGGDNVYTMNYPQLVSLSMLNYGRGMMDQNELIRGDGPADISVTSQVDILEYKPMTLDSIMRESSVFEVSGTVAPQGVVSGQEIFTSAGDTLIEVRGDAPVETPESLYIDNDDTAETLPWSALPEAFELQSKADNFKSDFEKALEEMLLA